MIALLAACASTPTDQNAADADRGASSAASTAGAAQPVGSDAMDANPLKDPKHILSTRSVFFEYDSDVIKDEFRPALQAHAGYLKQHAGAKMLIQGNADERGSREYNVALGQRRADAVRRMLVLMGATEVQIESVSLGKEKPRCVAHEESCWWQNRRGDMLYSGEY
jgi:peptidoglycan-associated lipoprotein